MSEDTFSVALAAAQEAANDSGSELVSGDALFQDEGPASENIGEKISWNDLSKVDPVGEAEAAVDGEVEDASGEADPVDVAEVLQAGEPEPETETAASEEDDDEEDAPRPWRPKSGRERRLVKERDLALEKAEEAVREAREIKEMLKKSLGVKDEEAGKQSEESLNLAEKLLKKMESIEERDRKREEAELNNRRAEALAGVLKETNERKDSLRQKSKVFDGAVAFLERYVEANVQKNKDLQHLPVEERYRTIAKSMTKRMIEWKRDGIDPAQGYMDLAEARGFDAKEFAKANGIRFDKDGNEVVETKAEPEPEPTKTPAKKPVTAVEKVAASRTIRNNENLGTASGLSGRPSRLYNPKAVASITDEKERAYAIRQAQQRGDLPRKLTMESMLAELGSD